LTVHGNQSGEARGRLNIFKDIAEGATKALLEFARDSVIKIWQIYYQPGSSKSHNSFNIQAPYTMVLIGQTGSGKTSFLNLLLNINKLVDINNNLKTMNTFQRYNDIKLEMNGGAMESKTANSTIYDTTFQHYKMKVIDTPGFGDSRGMGYDAAHRRNIIDIIKQLTYVNCIILVINGREARMTTQLRYVIDDITSIMPEKIRNNIVVMFTNVDDLLNLNFEISSLKEYIRTDIKHYWYVENPICKLEKVQSKKHRKYYESNYIVEEDILDSLKQAFQQTTERILDMYNVISHFKAVHSDAFLEIYDLKEKIEIQYLRLTIEHKNLLADIDHLNELKKQVQSHANRKEVFKNINKTETYETTKLIDTPYHNTLCAHSGCNHNCHENCSLPMTLERGHDIFKGCAAMDESGLKCRICGHSYKDHYHVRAKYVRTTETRTYIDPTLLKQFNSAKDDEERTMIALKSLAKNIEENENKLNKIFEEIRKLIIKYETLGLPKSYLRLLQSRLAQTILTIETYSGDVTSNFYKELLKSKEDLETRIHYAINMITKSVDDDDHESNEENTTPHDHDYDIL
jgi:GTP-binding protein EngB required for normal cell division